MPPLTPVATGLDAPEHLKVQNETNKSLKKLLQKRQISKCSKR